MKKSEDLERIATALHALIPDWARILSRFCSHPDFNADNIFSEVEYAKFFSEIYLDLALENIAAQNAGLPVDFNPIPQGSESEKYRFYTSPAGRLFAHQKINPSRWRRLKYEYDKLLKIGDLPVVFEIKLSTWKQHVKDYFRSLEYDKRLKPIRQYFRQDVGFVFIVPNDLYHGKEGRSREGSVFEEFKRRNGLVVPFYTDRKSFREETLENVRKQGLNLK